jgi:hypothetical protein
MSMLVIMIAHVCPVFVPFSFTDFPQLADFNESYDPERSTQHPNLLALVLPDTDPREIVAITAQFADIAVLFPGAAEFVTFREYNIANLLGALELKAPGLIFFHKGTLTGFCQFPRAAESLAFRLFSWFSPPPSLAHTLPELFGRLGNFPLAVIAKPASLAIARDIITKSARLSAMCDLIEVTDSIFFDLELESGGLALYRETDNAIVPIEESAASIFRASFPYYSQLTPGILELPGVFAAYLDEEYNESKHSRLFELASRHTMFRFGILERCNFAILDRINRPVHISPDFVVFSLVDRVFFPSTDLAGIDIESASWEDLAEHYLRQIEEKTLQGQYVSEPEVNPSSFEYVTKVVGSTYNGFVDDPNYDVVMFYRGSPGEHEQELAFFHSVAEEIITNGTRTMKFGYINARLNSPPGRAFPIFVNIPHVEMFPATAKRSMAPMLGFYTKPGFLRFLKEYSTLPNTLDPEPVTTLEALNEHSIIRGKIGKMPLELAQIALAYAERLEALLNGSTHSMPSPAPRQTDGGTDLL